jgi:hypothetical protein
MLIPYPCSYVDWTVPTDETGREVGLCTREDTYHFYLRWLADYLYHTHIPVAESQQPILARYQSLGVDRAVLDISTILGYSTWDEEEITELQEIAAGGMPFAEYHAKELAQWNALTDQEKEEWDGYNPITSEKDYVQLANEYHEKQKMPWHICHADIGYRPILAAMFKDLHDPQQRYFLLDLFYTNFNNNIID